MEESRRQDSRKESHLPWQDQSKPDLIPSKQDILSVQEPSNAPQISEFVVSVSAVLETTGVDTASRYCHFTLIKYIFNSYNCSEQE